MPQRIPEDKLKAIESIVGAHPKGIGISDIARNSQGQETPRRTLQYRLKYLVDQGRLSTEGKGRWMKYHAPGQAEERGVTKDERHNEGIIQLSTGAVEIQDYVRQTVEARKPVGYDPQFLNDYRAKNLSYLTDEERTHLRELGTPVIEAQPAGTYARQILSRLLIDLSWNSSRLEGNTYSLLDTKRLFDFGQQPEGKEQLETQMILNHKDAIEFLVDTAHEIGFNNQTILNLHALLSNNLLADPEAPGRLRHIAVGIEKSVFHPLEMPQRIEEYFSLILQTADAIKDPFEQSLFAMVQLPYLQPFDDVNKRVARLAGNIPFIKENLIPLSFTDVRQEIYTEAMLGIYELNKIDLFKEVYIWAYERSAARYAAVRQSIGEPDPFRLKHREALREVVKYVALELMDKNAAFWHVAVWAKDNIDEKEQAQFREIAENELSGLHEGNFARYQLRPSEYRAWQESWHGIPGSD